MLPEQTDELAELAQAVDAAVNAVQRLDGDARSLEIALARGGRRVGVLSNFS